MPTSLLWGNTGELWNHNRLSDWRNAGYNQGGSLPADISNTNGNGVVTTSGGVRKYGPGTYTIDAQTLFGSSLTRITGAGRDSTTLRFTQNLNQLIGPGSGAGSGNTYGYSWSDGLYETPGALSNLIFEDCTIECVNTTTPAHHAEPGWNAIEFKNVTNGVIRRMRFKNCDTAIFLTNCVNCTVDDVIIDSTRTATSGVKAHYGVDVNGTSCSSNLVRNVQMNFKAWHDLSVQNGCTLNVFEKCTGTDLNMDHHKQNPHHNLWVDINCGAATRVWDSSGPTTGGQNNGAGEVFWNIRKGTGVSITTLPPFSSSAWNRNLAVVGHTTNRNLSQPNNTSVEWVEALNPVVPTDLYLSQQGTTPPANDTQAPGVAITAPAASAQVSGSAVTISATASDDTAVVGVTFQLNGVDITSEDTASPYTITWNTLALSDGSYSLRASARDAAGNVGTSPTVAVTVTNGAPVPTTITLTLVGDPIGNPYTGELTANVAMNSAQFFDNNVLKRTETSAPYSLFGDVGGVLTAGTLGAGAHTIKGVALLGTTTLGTDTVDIVEGPPEVPFTIQGVQFQLDGVNLGSVDTSDPYTTSWDTTTASNGSHTLVAIASANNGSLFTSQAVVFIVSNSLADTTPPTISAFTTNLIGPTSASVTYLTNESASSIVFYGQDTGYASFTSAAGVRTGHTIVISGLATSTLHYIEVRPVDVSGNQATTSMSFMTTAVADTGAPVISSVAVAASNTTTLLFTFNTDEASDTRVEVRTTLGGLVGTETTTSTTVTTAHSLTVGSLVANTQYFHQVNAYDAAGNSAGWQSVGSTRTLAAADTTPPNFVLTSTASTDQNTNVIAWTTDEPASTYLAYGLTTANLVTTTEIDTNPRLVTHSVTVGSLSPATSYQLVVYGNDSAGNLGSAGFFTFNTALPPTLSDPDIVISDVFISDVTRTTAKITYLTDTVSTTQIAFGTDTTYSDGNSPTTLDTTLVTSHVVTLSNLSPGLRYYLQLGAMTAGSTIVTSPPNPQSTYSFITRDAANTLRLNDATSHHFRGGYHINIRRL